MPNPNFKNKFYHGKTKAMRFPECFEEILSYVCDKLDKQLIAEIDLERLIKNFIENGINDIKGIKINQNNQNFNYTQIDIDSLLKYMDSEQKLNLLKKLLKD